VAPPLAAVFIYLAVTLNIVWVLGLAASVWLFLQGLRKREDARGQVAEWLHRTDDSSPALRRFEEWIANDLPRLIDEARTRPATSFAPDPAPGG
jgi:hypothetical protein